MKVTSGLGQKVLDMATVTVPQASGKTQRQLWGVVWHFQGCRYRHPMVVG